MEIEIIVGIAILVALVFLATVDLAFSHLSDISLRKLSTEAEESGRLKTASFLREIVGNRPRFRFTLSSSIHLLLISFTVLGTVSLLEFTTNRSILVPGSLAIGLLSTIIFRQLIPRIVTRNDPERKLMALLPAIKPLYFLGTLASALVASLTGSARGPARDTSRIDSTSPPESLDERTEDNNDDLQALIEVGEAEGIIEERDREMIESMVEFSETRVGEIMTPRTEIVALPIESTIRAARDLIIDQKYSRLPVYRDSIDNVEGVIYVRDLLLAWANGMEEQSIAELIRPAYFVPETKSAADLLKKLQTEHVQIAIVIDEYGGVAGVVTVEDILEEIVGEIEDEDIEEEEIIEIIEGEDGYWDVLGSTEIDKIERLFDLELEDEEYSTIAGLVTSEAGYVPKIGEKLSIKGLDVEILKSDEKRITLIRIRPTPL